MEDNLSQQVQEVEVLQSIYGPEFQVENSRLRTYSIKIEEGNYIASLQFTYPEGYPSDCGPKILLTCPWLKGPRKTKLNDDLNLKYGENPGEIVVFQLVQHLKDFMESYAISSDNKDNSSAESSDDERSSKSPSPESSIDSDLTIFSGPSIEEKRSVFMAHLAHITNSSQVRIFKELLMRNRRIAEATHNILAYRVTVPDKNTIDAGCDDDGEHAAGGRLLHLLTTMDARDVVVIVTRWYGGIKLGPDRFRQINEAANQLLLEHGYRNRISGKKPMTNKSHSDRKKGT